MPMNPVSVAELASIRADAASTLALTCIIKRPTFVQDVNGFETETPLTTVTTTAAGMREPTAGQLQIYAEYIGTLASWVVNVPYGTDIRIKDQLTIEGRTLQVQVPLSPQGYDALATFLASEIRTRS